MRILFILLLLSNNLVYSQCLFRWVNIDGTGDTLVSKERYILAPTNKHREIAFEQLIEKIKSPRFDNDFQNHLKHLIDSLEVLSTQEAHKEAEVRRHDLNSVFQIITQDSIQYALYCIDTFNFTKYNIPIYQVVTNFTTEWSEDAATWTYYFTREFGVIVNSYFDFELNYEKYSLVDNCKIEPERLKIKDDVIKYVISKRENY